METTALPTCNHNRFPTGAPSALPKGTLSAAGCLLAPHSSDRLISLRHMPINRPLLYIFPSTSHAHFSPIHRIPVLSSGGTDPRLPSGIPPCSPQGLGLWPSFPDPAVRYRTCMLTFPHFLHFLTQLPLNICSSFIISCPSAIPCNRPNPPSIPDLDCCQSLQRPTIRTDPSASPQAPAGASHIAHCSALSVASKLQQRTSAWL